MIWRASASGKIVESLGDGRYLLYRDQFFDAIKQEFNHYLKALHSADSATRRSFLKHMDEVASES